MFGITWGRCRCCATSGTRSSHGPQPARSTRFDASRFASPSHCGLLFRDAGLAEVTTVHMKIPASSNGGVSGRIAPLAYPSSTRATSRPVNARRRCRARSRALRCGPRRDVRKHGKGSVCSQARVAPARRPTQESGRTCRGRLLRREGRGAPWSHFTILGSEYRRRNEPAGGVWPAAWNGASAPTQRRTLGRLRAA
jgi:hypothetical protein